MGVNDRRLIQLLQSALPGLKLSHLPKAPQSENLTSLASDIESMVTRLGAPATERVCNSFVTCPQLSSPVIWGGIFN